MTLSAAVASFCDRTFQMKLGEESAKGKDRRNNLLIDNRLFLSFGVHPKDVETFWRYRKATVQRLKRLMDMSRVVAFGEIGLDFTEAEAEWDRQVSTLVYMFEELGETIRQKKLPLVLHVREREGMPTRRKATAEIRTLLQRFFPAEYPIQLHYFTGKAVDVESWLEAFPQTHFSVSGDVRNSSAEKKAGVVAIPSDRLLLETDAPYAPVTGSFTEW
ncbi:putative deoxyribonuclease TATDN2 [Littorina saxatilis]|uniref:putative deoxyribonuclease TATDN2 n=1 Tax=Littorina saxatilis TaxID=31220 RepID=UPI0038B421C3